MGAGMWKRLTMLCQWRWWWWLQWCQGLNKWSQILTFPKFALKHIKTKHPHKHTHTYPRASRASRRWSAKKRMLKRKYTHTLTALWNTITPVIAGSVHCILLQDERYIWWAFFYNHSYIKRLKYTHVDFNRTEYEADDIYCRWTFQ